MHRVSTLWLDLHCLSDDRRIRLPNAGEGHSELEAIASAREALVCFEATNGVFGRAWRRRGLKRGSCLRRKSRRSGKAGAL